MYLANLYGDRFFEVPFVSFQRSFIEASDTQRADNCGPYFAARVNGALQEMEENWDSLPEHNTIEEFFAALDAGE